MIRKSVPRFSGSCSRPRRPGLEVYTKHQSCLVPFEVDEIERGVRPGSLAPGLNAPGRRDARRLRQLEIGGRTDEEGLARQFVEADSVVFPKIPRFAAKQ